MPVFKVFFKVLNKRKASLLMYIMIYLALTLFLSSVMKEKEETGFSKVTLDIVVENRDQGQLGKALTGYLGERHCLQEMPSDKERLQDAMYYQIIDYVLVIPEGFTEKMAAGGSKPLLEGTIVPGSSAKAATIFSSTSPMFSVQFVRNVSELNIMSNILT